MNTEKAIVRIIEETGIDRKEILKGIQKKKEELKGLISTEGAIFVIAKEYGIDLIVNEDKEPESKKGNWMEDLANIEIGKFEIDEEELKIVKGYLYTFRMLDSKKKPKEVRDVFQGKESKQIKYQFWVNLIGVSPSKKMYGEILKEEKPLIYDWVNSLVKGKDYKLKLSKTATKQFAQFCLNEQINNDSIVRYMRLGESGTTSYSFTKLGKKGSEELEIE